MIKERYFYYQDGDRIVRKRGFLYTGPNPFKDLGIDIFIVGFDKSYVAYIDVGNLVLLVSNNGTTRTNFIEIIEQRLSKIDKRSYTYKVLNGVLKGDIKYTKFYEKHLERYHNFKTEYMRQTMSDIKDERG